MRVLTKAMREAARAATAASPESALPIAENASPSPPATDENPTHREDFMRLVNAAARKPEPKD
jgi:hypothetical protein